MKRGVLYGTALLVLVNVALLVFFLVRPGPRPPRVDESGEIAGDVQAGVYSVTGVVKELRADGSNIVVTHEMIPGFMPAMTMPFAARDSREIATLRPGEKIAFRLLVTADESWIDSVQRLDQAPSAPSFDLAQSRIVRDVEPLVLGQVVPDYVFTNELGQATKLSDFRGGAVALTFIFTRCPLPEFCPRMLKNFSSTMAALRVRDQAPTNWHLITVTIDPAFDTPAVLRNYAERHQYDPQRWNFLTGALIDIDALAEQVGLVFRRQTPNALPDHNLRTLVIDRQGRLAKTIVGNTWRPDELVEGLVEAAQAPP